MDNNKVSCINSINIIVICYCYNMDIYISVPEYYIVMTNEYVNHDHLLKKLLYISKKVWMLIVSGLKNHFF